MSKGTILWYSISEAALQASQSLADILGCQFTIHRIKSVTAIASATLSPLPTVVFLDFEYPDMNDLKLLRQVKHTYPSVPLFMLTSFHSEELAVWAFRAGARDFFVKPVDVRQVIAKVESCMVFLARQRSEIRPVALSSHLIPMQIVLSHSPGKKKSQEICQLIAQRYHKRITLVEAARIVSMSSFQLSRLFKEEVGVGFKEYLVNYRLTKARDFLSNTIDSITDIACAVGFNDLSNFQRLFRKRYGVTPREFRQKEKAPLASQPITARPRRTARRRSLVEV